MAGLRFDRALAQLVPGRTKSQLQKMVRRGDVLLDGKRVVRSNFSLHGGETIRLKGLQAEEASQAPGPDLAYLEIADSFAVIDKPAGLLTHPLNHTRRADSVSQRLVERFGPLPTVEDEPRPGIVHRLDRETSGLMVIAREEQALDELRRQFRERSVEKHYLAWVDRRPEEDSFRIDAALEADPQHTDRQRVARAGGKAAVTEFRVLQSSGAATLVECRPLHGRRHQLRVHLAHAGCPIWGDRLYGSRQPGRVRLHAARLSFDHPEDGQRLTFESARPGDMDKAPEARA